jgi:hypothetical protein
MTGEEFEALVSGFWRHAVWVHKKIMRGEARAALRWMHRELFERCWHLLEEESKVAGRSSRPEARHAERWLDARRLSQTAITTTADQKILAQALLAEMDLFEEVTHNVANAKRYIFRDPSALIGWMRVELENLSAGKGPTPSPPGI